VTHRATLVGFALLLFAAGCTSWSVSSGSKGAAHAPQTRFTLTGSFQAVSTRTRAHEEGCAHRSTGQLIYESDPIRLGRGPAVARVEFFVRRYRGARPYAATLPAPYYRTAVQVVTGRSAATGVASGFYVASSGRLWIRHAENVGRDGQTGWLEGTVRATLHVWRGDGRLRLAGHWRCRIDPTSNEG
jgi:hypothetical protein